MKTKKYLINFAKRLALMTIFLGASFCFSNNASATDAVLSVSIANNIALDISSVSSSGMFNSSSSSSTTVSVTTNYYSGYTLGIKAKTANQNALINSSDNTKTIPSITSAVAEENYRDDSYASTNNLNNTWGYKPSKYNSQANTNDTFYPAPTSTSTTTVLDKTTSANPTTANTYNIAIGARVDANTIPGTYENTLVITVVANPTPYTITYNKNTEDTVTNMPANVNSNTSSNSIRISSSTPARSGYEFLGWCDTTTTIENYQDVCSGTTYAKSSSYTIDATTSNNLTLYAMWQRVISLTFVAGNNIETIIIANNNTSKTADRIKYATPGNEVSLSNILVGTEFIVTVVPNSNYKLGSWTSTTSSGSFTGRTLLTTTFTSGSNDETLTANGISGSYTNMQNLSSCPASGVNVTDTRDGKSYTVAKIGNYCYMLSNLRLDNTTDGTTPRVLTSADSDITPNSDYTSFTMPTEEWNTYYYCKAMMKVSNHEYYYNWYAAKANPHICDNPSDAYNNATITSDSYSLGSICPAGWTLPDYSTDLTPSMIWDNGANPGMITYTGTISTYDPIVVGLEGGFTSRTRNNANNHSIYYYRQSGNSPQYYTYNFTKRSGLSVRCIRENQNPEDAAFTSAGKSKVQATDPVTGQSGTFYKMQDMTASICSNIPSGSEFQLVDSRDNKIYWNAKLEDGNCWMTQNLDLDLSTEQTLTSDDTDLNLYGSMGYDSENGYSQSGDAISFTPERNTMTVLNSTNWQADRNNPYSYDPGISYPDENVSESVAGYHGLAGNYYNWTATIASNNSDNTQYYFSQYDVASNSICPKGWRLPNINNQEYSDILYTYDVTTSNTGSYAYKTGGFAKMQSSPLYFVQAGYVNSGKMSNVGTGASYWSSVVRNNDYAYRVSFSSSIINPVNSYIRSGGLSVRCIAPGT